MRLAAALLLPLLLSAQEIRLVQAAPGLSAPTDIQSANDGSGRVFLVEQRGLIKILRNGAVLAQPFLDLRGRVSPTGDERGLLGLAFPPSYTQSQRFYVNYTNLAGHTVIAQYQANGDTAAAGTEVILLTINQPFSNHNGGQLRFGPDGFLYIGMGDGGSGGDPQNLAQNMGSLLGKMLRVDVESQPGQVRIPASNPFVNTAGVRPEIWASGLRNPWRFSFDRTTGDMWIGDVGQNIYEEIDFQPANSTGGENYGWRDMEGAHCFVANCSTAGKILPVAEYTHAGGACSVTGGFVYRGQRWPTLQGTYLYADFCSGRIWGLSRPADAWVSRTLLDSGLRITTFGQDEDGELFVGGGNAAYRVESTAVPAPRFTAAAVVNAASFASGVVPGSLATVFVSGVREAPGISSASALPLPRALDGVSLTVGGVTAPLLSVSNVGGSEQVNFQVPFEIAGRSTADVIVTRSLSGSAPQSVAVLTEQPGIYSAGGRGIVVHNVNFSLVTDAAPLVAGEFAFFYAAGLGAVTNAPTTGAAAGNTSEVRSRVRVTLGGQPCEVQFAGLAPGFAGVYQVNFRVPSGIASGLRELVVGVGSVDSPVVTLPVR